MLDSLLSLFMVFSANPTNYDKVLNKLNEIISLNPAQVQMITIGTNDQGQPIRGLKIGQGGTSSLVVATHHGNEYGSTATALGFAESIARNPIADQSVYIIPVLNISGYNRNSRYESNLQTSVDPNRDYLSPCKSDRAFLLKSTQSLAQFLVDKDIQISATLHTYFPAVVYPWGISTTDLNTPYDQVYQSLVRDATLESRYRTGNNTQVLYPADGTFEDYAYWKHGIWSLLFELGFSHNPDSVAIKNMIEVNTPGLRRFLENSPKTRVVDHDFKGQCDSRSVQRVILE
ncbi:MAG: M14 family zinc carboxypeptidase [Pseudobdellovibrio sp.]